MEEILKIHFFFLRSSEIADDETHDDGTNERIFMPQTTPLVGEDGKSFGIMPVQRQEHRQ